MTDDSPKVPPTPNADRVGAAIAQVRGALRTLGEVDRRLVGQPTFDELVEAGRRIQGGAETLARLEARLRYASRLPAPDPGK